MSLQYIPVHPGITCLWLSSVIKADWRLSWKMSSCLSKLIRNPIKIRGNEQIFRTSDHIIFIIISGGQHLVIRLQKRMSLNLSVIYAYMKNARWLSLCNGIGLIKVVTEWRITLVPPPVFISDNNTRSGNKMTRSGQIYILIITLMHAK